VINNIKIILLFFLITHCSLDNKTGFWTKEQDLVKDQGDLKLLFQNENIITREFNNEVKININKKLISRNTNTELDNNEGLVDYQGNIKKISKYNYSKIKQYKKLEPDLIFFRDGIIFFDNNGSILKFDNNSKLIWKKNYYSKNEKKLNPLLHMTIYKNTLVVADNLSKYYALDAISGEILWSEVNTSPFNSQIKIYDDKIFIIDTENILNCYSLKDGKKIWNKKTEKPFVNSSKKLSLVIKNNNVIFNNSLGDITSVKTSNGNLIWQISTQTSQIYEDIFNLKISDLVADDLSVYFSNNNNQFFSLDLDTGTVNWKQKVNSSLRPIIVANLLFSISSDGHLIIIEKKTGNIIRITNILNSFKKKIRNQINLTGFLISNNNIFVTTTNGRIIVVNIENGKSESIYKITNNKISRPFILDQKMFVVKDSSIFRIN
jgi:outer membrane protein assembly factor BamB